MVGALKKHHISFKNAFAGLRYAFTSQPNFKVHFFLAFVAIMAGLFLKASSVEMTILVLTVVIGFAVEAKIAKDVSAGMMLLTAFGAILVAILILGPKVAERLLWPFF